jgi:hypothetical protein
MSANRRSSAFCLATNIALISGTCWWQTVRSTLPLDSGVSLLKV